jgi:hypothetical protein
MCDNNSLILLFNSILNFGLKQVKAISEDIGILYFKV